MKEGKEVAVLLLVSLASAAILAFSGLQGTGGALPVVDTPAATPLPIRPVIWPGEPGAPSTYPTEIATTVPTRPAPTPTPIPSTPTPIPPTPVPPTPTAASLPPNGYWARAKISYYWPPLGGPNCAVFVNGQCISKMASGRPWQKWVDRALACPREFPFGTRFVIQGKEWICLDRGGAIRYIDGQVFFLDLLTPNRPPYTWQIIKVYVIPPQ